MVTDQYGNGWIPIGELQEAVSSGFLSPEEARTVVWSQLPVLRQQAATTAPPIAKAGQ